MANFLVITIGSFTLYDGPANGLSLSGQRGTFEQGFEESKKPGAESVAIFARQNARTDFGFTISRLHSTSFIAQGFALGHFADISPDVETITFSINGGAYSVSTTGMIVSAQLEELNGRRTKHSYRLVGGSMNAA